MKKLINKNETKKSIFKISNNCTIGARTKLDSQLQLNFESSKVILTKFNITFLPA